MVYLLTYLFFLQILTGKPPFHHVTWPLAVVFAKAKGLPKDCDYLVEYTETWKVIERCAAFEPEKRPSMIEVVGALDDLTKPICHPSSRYILAHRASSYASLLEPVLLAALTNLQFEGHYMIQVGFNETSLREGMLIEEIYLLLDGELQSSEDYICATLGAVFALFPGIVYTPHQTYYVPIDPPPQGSVGRLLELGGKVRAVQNTGNASGSGAGGASPPQSKGTGHDNQKKSGGQNANKQGREKEGGREPGDQGDSSSDDDDDDSKGKGRDLDAKHKGKEPGHGPGLNISFSSSLSIKGSDGTQKVTAAANIDITVRFFVRFGVVRESMAHLPSRSTKIRNPPHPSSKSS